ncbi:hypothetical protein ACVWXN_004474 [Bradyrhizobium sp. i1.4.4]
MPVVRFRLSDLKSTKASGASIAALVAGALGLAALTMSSVSFAQNIRGSATGPTTAKGYDHPDQFIHLKPVKPADNMYPVIAHSEQEQQARGKLADLERKTGKKPNLIVFLLDDVAWTDPGFNGGGIAVGNETPTMDKLGQRGAEPDLGLLDAELLAEPRHDHDRAEPAAPWHSPSADVWRAGRA